MLDTDQLAKDQEYRCGWYLARVETQHQDQRPN